MEHKKIEINGSEILPGSNETIRLNIARLPSGTRINLQIHVYRSENPGPVMLVMGGVHGDEINGVEIVRRSIVHKYYDKLRCGTVIAIPLLNIYGFINFSRDTPDGKDVNRNFPGNTRGSLSSRVAATITKKILPLIDFGIDFHTGADSRFNYPQVRYSPDDAASKELAAVFAAPYLVAKNPITKSLRRAALKMQKPILIYEGGESLRLDGLSIQCGLEGLLRVMHAHKMVKNSPSPIRKPRTFQKSSWLRASRSGLFCWTRQSGAKVRPGDILGTIHDPYGEYEIKVYTKRGGYIIGHNNAPVVSMGDALFHIGYEEVEP